MYLWGLSSPKSVGQASRLETWMRVDASVLRLNSTGQQAGKLRQSFCVTVLKQNPFYFGEPHSLLLRPSTDWMRPTHIMEGNLPYSKSTDLMLVTSNKYLHSNI